MYPYVESKENTLTFRKNMKATLGPLPGGAQPFRLWTRLVGTNSQGSLGGTVRPALLGGKVGPRTG